VANLVRQMRPETRQEVRAAVLDWIRSKSVIGVEDTAKFSQAAYNKALQAIGDRKLGLLFAGDREALQQLQALGRVGAYVQNPPVASGVNYSSSGTTGIDFLDQVTRLPVLNLLGRPGDLIRAAQVNALTRGTPTTQGSPAIREQAMDRILALATGLSAPTAATAAPQIMDQKSKREAMARALTGRR
jgi:hypothetical protein